MEERNYYCNIIINIIYIYIYINGGLVEFRTENYAHIPNILLRFIRVHCA